MPVLFDSEWWSIEIADGWQLEDDEGCYSIVADSGGGGALQVSAYQNEIEPVATQMLMEFAVEECPDSIVFVDRKFGDFDGVSAEFQQNSTYWRKAWLKNEDVMLYVTYNCDIANKSIETDVVDHMLATLKCNSKFSRVL